MNQNPSPVTSESAAFEPTLLKAARDEAKRSGEPLIAELERLAGLAPHGFVRAVGATLHYRTMDGETLATCTPDFSKVPLAEAMQRECLFVTESGGATLAVIADPFDSRRLAWLDARGHDAEIVIVHRDSLADLLARCEEGVRASDGLASTSNATARSDTVEKLSLARISEDASVVVKLVNATLYDALKSHASDIHLESTPNGLAIKYRIDGVLSSANRTPGVEIAEQVISRIKVMAELDISERRVPQDGRFKVEISGREIDFRVSIMPSIFGEDAVLRILDKQDLADAASGVRLESLGFDDATMKTLRKLAGDPYGMVLVTGPTGSGKTTTLYAMVSEVNSGHDKIITIEDPVEYQLPGILQIPVNERKGLTFARGLRSILRHDPDKIMVGEIRDSETAQIAVQSALTGHLVYTTIHANNVFDVIGRFTQMGVDAYSFVSALNGILAQRLVRLVCRDCAKPIEMSADQLADAGLDPDRWTGVPLFESVGCARCRGTGFRGRSAIAEILIMDDDIRQMIVDRQPISRVRETARSRGLKLLRESALQLMHDGKTTLSEINRVTFA